MALREYVIPGNGRDITVKLDEDSAARLGDKAVLHEPVKAKQAEKPANKARSARDK